MALAEPLLLILQALSNAITTELPNYPTTPPPTAAAPVTNAQMNATLLAVSSALSAAISANDFSSTFIKSGG
jgi:hypothetical protein